MAVNLGRTDCRFCGGEVLLDEEPRRLKEGEVMLLPEHLRHARIANATCFECSAEYVAWFDALRDTRRGETDTLRDTPSGRRQFPLSATSLFRDLSHRSTMSSEPGEADLPMHVIDSVRIKRTWPTCLVCKKRIFESRGCQCPEPQPLEIVVHPLLVVPEWRSHAGSTDFAITTYDLFVVPFADIVGDEHEWASLRALIEISYLVSLEEEVRVIDADLREHWISVSLPPTGARAYEGDDRNYHRTIENIVNRAGLVVEAEMFELGPETPIDGGAGPWIDPKSAYILQPHRDEYHWLAAFCWAYSKLPHHWIHIMQEQVNAYRGKKNEGQAIAATTERWWASLEDNKLVRPIAYCERDLPLGIQIGGLYIMDGAAFVAEDKRAPRAITPRVIEIDSDDDAKTPPPDPAYDGARDDANWPAATIIGQYPNPPTEPPFNASGFKQQYPNTTRSP